MNLLEALILGIVQGLTEFLPVSSSGHIELGKAIFGNANQENLTFTIIVHCATVLSTIVIFRWDIWNIFKNIFSFQWNNETQYAAKIVVSMIPVLFVGLLLKEPLESLFTGNILLVGVMLLITGSLLLFTSFVPQKKNNVSFKTAFLIGIAQAVAVLPGISRSGATIATGLMLGVDKKRIAGFSFLMVIVPILGGTALEVKELMEQPQEIPVSLGVLIVGFLAAFISGLIACKWMIRIVENGKIQYFAFYCFLIGTIAIVVSCL